MTKQSLIYLIGSLRNRDEMLRIGNELRSMGRFDVFDDWLAAGPTADDEWKVYEEGRGRTYKDALSGRAAKHVFDFDKHHLDRANVGVLVAPAGKSGHMELGYMIGRGKPGLVLMDRPDRWDVMYQFADAVTFSLDELKDALLGLDT